MVNASHRQAIMRNAVALAIVISASWGTLRLVFCLPCRVMRWTRKHQTCRLRLPWGKHGWGRETGCLNWWCPRNNETPSRAPVDPINSARRSVTFLTCASPRKTASTKSQSGQLFSMKWKSSKTPRRLTCLLNKPPIVWSVSLPKGWASRCRPVWSHGYCELPICIGTHVP